MQHRTRALPTQQGTVYTAICSCRWHGPDRKGPSHKEDAINDANEHELKALKDSDPAASSGARSPDKPVR